MDRASVLEIPNAAASSEKVAKDPYEADTKGLLCSQRKTGTREFAAIPSATRHHSATCSQRGPGRTKWNEADSDIFQAEGILACSYIVAYTEESYDDSQNPVSEIKLATALIVGWSNKNVCGSSVVNHSVSVLANSVAAIESRPDAMSGAFAATSVPCASQMTAEIVRATESRFRGWTSRRTAGIDIRSCELREDSSSGPT